MAKYTVIPKNGTKKSTATRSGATQYKDTLDIDKMQVQPTAAIAAYGGDCIYSPVAKVNASVTGVWGAEATIYCSHEIGATCPFAVNDILLVCDGIIALQTAYSTHEYLKVKTVAANFITVYRNWGNTDPTHAKTILWGHVLIKVGEAPHSGNSDGYYSFQWVDAVNDCFKIITTQCTSGGFTIGPNDESSIVGAFGYLNSTDGSKGIKIVAGVFGTSISAVNRENGLRIDEKGIILYKNSGEVWNCNAETGVVAFGGGGTSYSIGHWLVGPTEYGGDYWGAAAFFDEDLFVVSVGTKLQLWDGDLVTGTFLGDVIVNCHMGYPNEYIGYETTLLMWTDTLGGTGGWDGAIAHTKGDLVTYAETYGAGYDSGHYTSQPSTPVEHTIDPYAILNVAGNLKISAGGTLDIDGGSIDVHSDTDINIDADNKISVNTGTLEVASTGTLKVDGGTIDVDGGTINVTAASTMAITTGQPLTINSGIINIGTADTGFTINAADETITSKNYSHNSSGFLISESLFEANNMQARGVFIGTGINNSDLSVDQIAALNGKEAALSPAQVAAYTAIESAFPVSAYSTLKAWYRFESGELTFDSSGNGHTLTAISDPAENVSGKFGGCVVLDSNDAYSAVGHADFRPTGSFTVGAWVKTTQNSVNYIFSSGYFDAPNYYGFRFYIVSKKIWFLFMTGTGSDSTQVIGSTDLNDNAWHFVVGIWDGSNLNVYVDGVADATPVACITAPVFYSSNNVRIGCAAHIASWFFNGSLDEVFLLNGTALNAGEVLSLYNAGSSGGDIKKAVFYAAGRSLTEGIIVKNIGDTRTDYNGYFYTYAVSTDRYMLATVDGSCDTTLDWSATDTGDSTGVTLSFPPTIANHFVTKDWLDDELSDLPGSDNNGVVLTETTTGATIEGGTSTSHTFTIDETASLSRKANALGADDNYVTDDEKDALDNPYPSGSPTAYTGVIGVPVVGFAAFASVAHPFTQGQHVRNTYTPGNEATYVGDFYVDVDNFSANSYGLCTDAELTSYVKFVGGKTGAGTTALYVIPSATNKYVTEDQLAATKLDDLAAPDNNTDRNASTTAHGLLLVATAPTSGLRNVVAIDNGETVYKNAALFDATTPAMDGTAATGSAMAAARRDHVHGSDTSRVTRLTSTTTNGIATYANTAGAMRSVAGVTQDASGNLVIAAGKKIIFSAT